MNLNKIFCFIFFAVITFLGNSCTTEFYPNERLEIDPSLLQLFNSMVKKDSFTFKNLVGVRKKFLITEMDSIIRNTKGWFTHSAPYKDLWINFKEIGNDTTSLERSNDLLVHKDPIKNVSRLYIEFNNFYFSTSTLPLLSRDTLILNGIKVANYYYFETKILSKDSSSIEELYMTPEKGFIGFKTLSGETWLREK